ncbi:MAG: serine hydrolase [Patescibacteria group bacterium]
MTKFNLQSFLFALVLLIAVLINKPAAPMRAKPIVEVDLQDTSLVAVANLNASIMAPIQSDLKPAPEIKASAAIAKELFSPTVFFELNTDQEWPIASLTKLMTAVVALEKIGGGQPITISETAVATEGVSGNFNIGETYAVNDLVSALMGVSSNDAAAALAEFYFDSKQKDLANEMERKAKRLGMGNTRLTDSTGLSPLNQSTIGDLEKLVKYIFKQHPEIFAASRQKEVRIGNRLVMNINKFADRPDFLGGKTGYTDEANGNLISIFNYNEKPILIIVLGSDDRFRETEKLYDYFTAGSNY